MTDEIMKDLVLKHDAAIGELAQSVNSLVESNIETNKTQAATNERLEEITKYLAKQAVFDTKLSSMDKDLTDSFKRVHKRIDSLETTQTSEKGCSSVQLLTKDVESHVREVTQLAGSIGDNRIHLESIERKVNAIPSPKVMMWLTGFIIAYMISFGTYVVNNMQTREVQIAKIVEHLSKD